MNRLVHGAEVLIDSAPIIYLLDGHPLAARFLPIFEAIETGRLRALITPITVAEVLGGPLRAGAEALVEQYRVSLTGSPNWRVAAIDADLAVLAARLRVRYALRLPDALQLAATLHHGCAALVTHDRDFARVTDVLIVDGV